MDTVDKKRKGKPDDSYLMRMSAKISQPWSWNQYQSPSGRNGKPMDFLRIFRTVLTFFKRGRK